jgi:hypothetical protein
MIVRDIEITSKYPYSHPYLVSVIPIMNEPHAAPNEPDPSMIPAIVEEAFLLCLTNYYFPRSAEQEAANRLFIPLIQNPAMHMDI